jgi:tetrahydromethanopterin S-methyltransferase subunit D
MAIVPNFNYKRYLQSSYLSCLRYSTYRTFLTTVEIVVICVFTILGVFLLIGLIVYVYYYGWTIPPCCRKGNKDYSQIQLQRERKIGEIWKQQNYVQRA